MSPKPITVRSDASPNALFYGDNLPILREYIPDESIDLILLFRGFWGRVPGDSQPIRHSPKQNGPARR